jgi:hypothetical protein
MIERGSFLFSPTYEYVYSKKIIVLFTSPQVTKSWWPNGRSSAAAAEKNIYAAAERYLSLICTLFMYIAADPQTT